MTKKRQNHEQPSAVVRHGWRYHHLGIPTSVPRPGEQHLKHLKVFVCGFDISPYGIEWIRFEPECQVDPLIRKVPHIAFEVDDLEKALKGCTMLGEISSPSGGVRVAMIVDDGAPIELIEFPNDKRRTLVNRLQKRGRLTSRSRHSANKPAAAINTKDGGQARPKHTLPDRLLRVRGEKNKRRR